MNENEDVLQIIPDKNVPKLRDVFVPHFPRTLYVYNLLNSAITWKRKHPGRDGILIMAPFGDWRTGTFILTHQYYCYEVYMFTLEPKGEALFDLIVNTKMIKWNERILIYSILNNHCAIVSKALSNTEFSRSEEIPCTLFYMPIEKALNLRIECPPNVYIDKLRKTHASFINSQWPHSYIGSEIFLSASIETLGGYGIFLKSTNKLVAWILRIKIGLGTLQVLEEYKRQGYGSLITKYAAREMARAEGLTPIASSLNNNLASFSMLSKVGFEKSEPVTYFQSENNTSYNIK